MKSMPTKAHEDCEKKSWSPAIFLGVADGEAIANPSTPAETRSLFELSMLKVHFMYPALVQRNVWCFLIRPGEFLGMMSDMRIQVLDPKGKEAAYCAFSKKAQSEVVLGNVPPAVVQAGATGATLNQKTGFILMEGQEWSFYTATFDDLFIGVPGEYKVQVVFDGVTYLIGTVVFAFNPPPPLTEEKISALEADIATPEVAILSFGCKTCASKLKTYIAVKRAVKFETDGAVFYTDLPASFACSCGKTNMDLTYVIKGGHGLLNRDARAVTGHLSYVSKYAHSQIADIANEFIKLIEHEKAEEVIQKFLERKKVLFARFSPKKFFIKPRILGKYNADFAILDAKGTLVLIEIERPNLKLFKKNGHLMADFNHAYEQVEDWLSEYAKHPVAVLEGMGLKSGDVLNVRGCVIAGRRKLERIEHLQRHMASPRQTIEFMTFDMLAESLHQLGIDLP